MFLCYAVLFQVFSSVELRVLEWLSVSYLRNNIKVCGIPFHLSCLFIYLLRVLVFKVRSSVYRTYKADFLNAVYFRRGLTCTLGLTNDLIDGGQPRAKNDCDLASLHVDGV